MLLLIPLVPFVGFLVNAAIGRRLTQRASGAVACLAVLGSCAVSVISTWRLLLQPPESRAVTQYVFTWINSGDFGVPFALRLDPLAAVMILIVTGVGSLIHIYSTAYMAEERAPEYARYFSYLNLFVAFMLVLVLGSNFLVMFVGWEGVGLCSYLLIGFWYERKAASDAGKKAFIVNRVGDFAFILGVLLVFVRFGTIDFVEVARIAAALEPEAAFGALSVITLLLFIGATGKSAQLPLHIWLPDAMEGPTPVSALIHAATMVTAGVYIIGRNAVLFSHAPQTLIIVATVGTATALVAGTIGLVQNDIKRVLAYSTVSQLGYMFLAMGVGAYAAGIFHLLTHAFFKALLFLGSGAVIHALAGEQDLRRMGGLRPHLPVTYWTFVIGALAIAGVPGLAGFFSKDEILLRAYVSGHTLLWVTGVVTALLTATYMFRVVFLAFHGKPRAGGASHALAAQDTGYTPPHGDPLAGEIAAPVHLASGGAPSGAHLERQESPAVATVVHRHLHDAPPAMALALVVLAAGSVLAGYVGLPHALGGSNRFEQFLAPSFAGVTTLAPGELRLPDGAETNQAARGAEASETLSLTLMALSTAVALGGIGIATFFFLTRREAAVRLAERFPGVNRLLLNKYYIDEVYDTAVVQPIRILSEEGLWKRVDVVVIDGAVNGVGESVSAIGGLLRQLQTGSVRAYAASFILGVVAIVGYYLWR